MSKPKTPRLPPDDALRAAFAAFSMGGKPNQVFLPASQFEHLTGRKAPEAGETIDLGTGYVATAFVVEDEDE